MGNSNTGETERYIANASEDPVYVLSENKNRIRSGRLESDGQSYSKFFRGNQVPLTEVPQGEAYQLEGKNQAITIVTKNYEPLCHGYAIPDGRGIIVSGERKELAKRGEIWVGESGNNYSSILSKKGLHFNQ